MLALEISESSDGAICMYNQLHIFREKASNTPQPLHRSVGGENAGTSVGPARDVGLGDPRFDLPGGDHSEVLDRALCRLCHRDEAGDAAVAAMLTRRRADGL